MSEPTGGDLLERLERIERANRRLKRVVVSAVVLVAAVLLLAPAAPKTAPKVLKAREVQVVDEQGVARITLTVEMSGEPRLTLSGPRTSAVQLALMKDQPVLSVRDDNRVRASLEVADAGTVLVLEDAEGKRAARLRAARDLGLFVSDVKSGRRGASLSLGDEGPSVSLSSPDEAGSPTIGLQVSPTFGPLLALTKGLAAASANVSLDGDPSITLADAQGHDRAVLGVTKLEVERRRRGKAVEKQRTEPSSLVLFNPDQTVVWKAP